MVEIPALEASRMTMFVTMVWMREVFLLTCLRIPVGE